jgi:hypothetical protein
MENDLFKKRMRERNDKKILENVTGVFFKRES